MLQSEPNQVTETKPAETDWRSLYKLGAFTALILIVLPPAEIVIGLLPGAQRASASTVTVVDWFSLFHDNWFLGLRNLGLLNLVGAALLAPTILAVYSALTFMPVPPKMHCPARVQIPPSKGVADFSTPLTYETHRDANRRAIR